MEEFGGSEDDEETISMGTGAPLFSINSPLMRDVLPMLQRLDPIRVRAVLGTLQSRQLIHDEGVITMMPEEIIIR